MGLIKVICQNCGQPLTLEESLNVEICPVCGASLKHKENNEVTKEDSPLSYDNCVNNALNGLKNNDFSDLLKALPLMKEQYPDSFFVDMFLLIEETRVDLIYHLPEIPLNATKEEIDEDLRSRYYFYARKKYHKLPQKSFNKIAGIYPDVPGETRGKWKRAITSLNNKEEAIKLYNLYADVIRNKYLEKLEGEASSKLEEDILYNLKVWLDRLSHSSIDFYAYGDKANEMVKEDFNKTPNPGNRTKFYSYMTVYLVSLFALIFNVVELIIEANQGSLFHGPMAYIFASISSLIYIFALITVIVAANMFQRFPILAIALVLLIGVICSGGIVTADLSGAFWFNITTIVIAVASIIVTTYKMVYYAPHKTNKNNTIIGNFNALADNSFEINFDYSWSDYQGNDYRLID